MFSVNTIESLAFVNAPYLYENICLVYPLTVGNVLSLQEKYDIALQILTIDRIKISNLLKEKGIIVEEFKIPEPFDYLLDSAELNDSFLLELKNAFRTFIKEEITILFDLRKIVIGSANEKRILNSSNFPQFQSILRIQNKIPEVTPIPEKESDIARKFREKREQRDLIKRKQESKNAPSFTTLMSALCAYGSGITPLNIKDISIFSFYTLSHINSARERYDIEMHYLYAGADPKKLKPKYWIIEEE